MSAPLELEEAQARLLAMLEPGASNTIAVNDSAGRYLAQPVVARRTQPPADLSAMDGYATASDGPWELVGESRAGAPFPKALSKGMATRISTGARMPFNTDAVLIQENARVEDGTLHAVEPPRTDYIRRAGLDFASGDALLDRGTHMGPAQIALARAGGCDSVVAYNSPRVAIIECGDELSEDPAACGSHKIPAVNGAMLATMAKNAGGLATPFGPVADNMAALVGAIEEASEGNAMIVVSGGASVGPHDLVKPALEAAGFTLDFWRIAIKPGKPLLVATRPSRNGGDTVVLGLPGNPVSSFVTGFFFMVPALRRLAGAIHCLPQAVPMPLAAPLPVGGTRREFLRAEIGSGGVCPAEVQDSSALLPLARAQVLVDRLANVDAAKAGAFVPCYPLENGAIA